MDNTTSFESIRTHVEQTLIGLFPIPVREDGRF